MAHSSSLITKVCASRKESRRWIPCHRKQHAMGIYAPRSIAARRQLQWTLRLRGFSRHFTRCQMGRCCAPFLRVRLERETRAYLPSQDRLSRPKIILQPRLTIPLLRRTRSRALTCLTAEPYGSPTSSTTNGRDTIHAGNSLPCTNLTPSVLVF